jgi:hypothetical protein
MRSPTTRLSTIVGFGGLSQAGLKCRAAIPVPVLCALLRLSAPGEQLLWRQSVPSRNRRYRLAALIALGDDLRLLLRGPGAPTPRPGKHLQPANHAYELIASPEGEAGGQAAFRLGAWRVAGKFYRQSRANRSGLSTMMQRTPLLAILSSMALKPARSAIGSAPLTAALRLDAAALVAPADPTTTTPERRKRFRVIEGGKGEQ